MNLSGERPHWAVSWQPASSPFWQHPNSLSIIDQASEARGLRKKLKKTVCRMITCPGRVDSAWNTEVLGSPEPAGPGGVGVMEDQTAVKFHLYGNLEAGDSSP